MPLPLLADLLLVVRGVDVDEVEMRRDLLAGVVVKNHRRFEVLHAVAAGVRHARLHEELHDVERRVVEVGEGVGAHLVNEVAFDDGVVDGGGLEVALGAGDEPGADGRLVPGSRRDALSACSGVTECRGEPVFEAHSGQRARASQICGSAEAPASGELQRSVAACRLRGLRLRQLPSSGLQSS